MLLIRQAGNVRVGEVIRYTLTYKPAVRDTHPSPAALHVKIKNTSAIPLRAAYLHGPYTLYASCYPASFDPNANCDFPDANNVPQFEPYLKAGGTWHAVIPIPRHNEQGDPSPSECPNRQSITWVVEIISQVVFSSTASVNFEVLVGGDEKSLNLLPHEGQSKPPKAAYLRDHWPSGSKGRQLLAAKGVFSDSITLLIDDTASLWNTPHLPTSHNDEQVRNTNPSNHGSSVDDGGLATGLCNSATSPIRTPKRRKIHLVVLTHGLHSNLGADMLYLKESIDAASERNRSSQNPKNSEDGRTLGISPLNSCGIRDDHDCQEEQVIVRGFPGNAARTERGIQYLGKRLAKYVLLMTYPDQPHLPRKKTKAQTYSGPFSPSRTPDDYGAKAETSCIDAEQLNYDEHHAYQITSISFIGHSLGGLVQTYAIAYIQKHTPDFFDKIRPINFIALATPFLGLSNENPLYVRFALDFGLVGRTGQDLGLSWTAPRARSGWEAIIGGKGESSDYPGHADARAKPLLRILPSGPAHEVLTKFKHRTIYSNLVNDGIVPLRTSCLLFLDWKGLERVEKARRENGIVGTMAEWGWAELTGANSKSPRVSRPVNGLEVTDASRSATEAVEEAPTMMVSRTIVTTESVCSSSSSPVGGRPEVQTQPLHRAGGASTDIELDAHMPPSSPLTSLFSMFKPKVPGRRQTKILKRSQTLATPIARDPIKQDESYSNQSCYDIGFNAPPQTTVFESAGDLLMPPLPPIDYIVNHASRPRTIFHDRIYRPEDIPPPIMKKKAPTLNSTPEKTAPATHPLIGEPLNETGLKVEEKIARAYHHGLSWRKVLVRLEPDAHNNIIVRRMFANAYGWPVVEHLVDTHFGSKDSCDDIPGSSTPCVGAIEDDSHDYTHLSSIAVNASVT
ncbi:putative serine esterase-domain-containing protein [Aspergillus cavernicola]|uniref:Serine esterase-domain-containing protein n=1 Tax=Aspergillus cavernicola TaxID=176166 RepID=A0ABR4H767_9EURO